MQRKHEMETKSEDLGSNFNRSSMPKTTYRKDHAVGEGVVTHEAGIGTAKHNNLTTTWHEAGGEHGPEGAAAGCCARLLRLWADAATATRRVAMADQRRRRRRQP
ncbi:hypothetical protein PIB30_096421, partial [Stylosanthes scabra]|nr:hypothetical protein [Stylosanthes scabra]